MLVLPRIIAARRKVVAARLTTLRVRELSTRCPLILLLGLNPSQETKAFSLRHFVMLVPISLTKVKIARTFNPGMVVRSTPRIRFRCPAKLISKATGAFLLRGLPRPKSGDWGVGSEAWLGLCAIGHFSQLLLNAQIALGDLLLDLAVVVQRLAEHEEQFRAVIARQRRFNLGLAFLNSMICQRGQFSGIAFPC